MYSAFQWIVVAGAGAGDGVSSVVFITTLYQRKNPSKPLLIYRGLGSACQGYHSVTILSWPSPFVHRGGYKHRR